MPRNTSEKEKLSEILQLPLVATDEPIIIGLEADPKAVFAGIQEFLMQGWCIEFMKDNRDEGITALCKCSAKGHINSGRGFYAKGDTFYACQVCALYKIRLADEKDLSFLSNQRKEVRSFS